MQKKDLERIEKARRINAVSKAAIARKFGVSPQWIFRIWKRMENGERLPDGYVERIREAVGLPPAPVRAKKAKTARTSPAQGEE